MVESAKELRTRFEFPEVSKDTQEDNLNHQLAMLGVYQQQLAPYELEAQARLAERLRIVEAERDMWRLESQRGCWPTDAQKEIDSLRLSNCHIAAQLKEALIWKDLFLEKSAELEELHSDVVCDTAMRHTFQVVWSEGDEQFVGTCWGYPSVSHLADRPVEAYLGVLRLVADIEANNSGEDEDNPSE